MNYQTRIRTETCGCSIENSIMKVILGIQHLKCTRALLYIYKLNTNVNGIIFSYQINFDGQLNFPNANSISTNIYVVLGD